MQLLLAFYPADFHLPAFVQPWVAANLLRNECDESGELVDLNVQRFIQHSRKLISRYWLAPEMANERSINMLDTP